MQLKFLFVQTANNLFLLVDFSTTPALKANSNFYDQQYFSYCQVAEFIK